ncbi:MAG: aldo/keto reductase [Methanotrichaceae archaeon]|nr:aldo/keto reductase [Methanotrichaceae archaeon]
MVITTRPFGKKGPAVTQVGLGGEGVLRTHGRTPEALAVIEEAAAQGINYFDSARAYAGSEGYYGEFWSEHSSLRPEMFLASKSASRDKEGAKGDLVHSLTTLGLDYLDLWQIHDVRTSKDLEKIEGEGGALEAFVEARDAGIVRFIGVTGHHDPKVLGHAVARWPVDAVLLPVNPLEAVIGGFLDRVLAAAEDRGIAVIGMKVLGGSHYISKEAGITQELLVRFALSQKIATAIVGCSIPQEVQALARAGREFEPMPHEEQEQLIEAFRPYARKLAFYRGVV